jgi:hypothetical protein
VLGWCRSDAGAPSIILTAQSYITFRLTPIDGSRESQ